MSYGSIFEGCLGAYNLAELCEGGNWGDCHLSGFVMLSEIKRMGDGRS